MKWYKEDVWLHFHSTVLKRSWGDLLSFSRASYDKPFSGEAERKGLHGEAERARRHDGREREKWSATCCVYKRLAAAEWHCFCHLTLPHESQEGNPAGALPPREPPGGGTTNCISRNYSQQWLSIQPRGEPPMKCSEWHLTNHVL